jgi:hypothetical protein
LIEAYLSVVETQRIRDEYSRAIKILDDEYKQVTTSLDEFIKIFQNLHADEQHQLEKLLQNMKI